MEEFQVFVISRKKIQHYPDVNVTCEDINHHFLSIAGNTVSDLPSVNTSPLHYINTCDDVPSMSMSEVDVQNVIEYISKLDTIKAVGVDGISMKFIQTSPHCMALLLTKLIIKSILSSSFPDCWKAAIVTLVLKSQNNTSLLNFRPISVLSVFSKILERVVSDQILAHFCKYNLFAERQSGFHHGYSTQDVLLHVTDSFLSAIDRGQYVGAVFLDLAKAFDCVDHNILLQKLHTYLIMVLLVKLFPD